MKIPDLKIPNMLGKARNSGANRTGNKRQSERVERTQDSRLLILSICAIILYISIAWVVVVLFTDEGMNLNDIVRGSMGSVFALLFAV
ncbi:MAG: hypothetical protein LBH88_04045, partial [Candidatus Methanoplasma sp.]|nr:hypothetical protein [Candidatus Methanoplasma sp.]